MSQNRYPKIYIRSKNDLAKRLSSDSDHVKMLRLINYVTQNKDKLWWDNTKMSEPEPKPGKFVRDASRTQLGTLLKLIDKKILAPHDNMLPVFIWGGITGRSNVLAVRTFLEAHDRSLLKMDLKRFFEQITRERVVNFFIDKAMCSKKAANLLADLVCVAKGPKDDPSDEVVLARGFATSTRLAVWCCLDFFVQLKRLANKKLKKFEPKIIVFIDDIGICVSGMKYPQLLNRFVRNIKEIAVGAMGSQPLEFNDKKTKIYHHTYKTPMDYLGVRLFKKSMGLAGKSRSHIHETNKRIKDRDLDKCQKKQLKRRRASIYQYGDYVQKVGKSK